MKSKSDIIKKYFGDDHHKLAYDVSPHYLEQIMQEFSDQQLNEYKRRVKLQLNNLIEILDTIQP